MRKATLAKGQLLRQSVHTEKSYLNKTGNLVLYNGNLSLVVALSSEDLMWTVTGTRPCKEAKLTPRSMSYPGIM